MVSSGSQVGRTAEPRPSELVKRKRPSQLPREKKYKIVLYKKIIIHIIPFSAGTGNAKFPIFLQFSTNLPGIKGQQMNFPRSGRPFRLCRTWINWQEHTGYNRSSEGLPAGEACRVLWYSENSWAIKLAMVRSWKGCPACPWYP